MRKTAAYAFHHSIPILIGFFPVGIAYGLLMQQAGYNFLWSGACSLFVLAGSLQFLMVTFFAGGVALAYLHRGRDHLSGQRPPHFLRPVVHRQVPFLRPVALVSDLFAVRRELFAALLA